jgi:prolyl-tRNA editing enzyme YbaK/EbsC (Cys-tRNA(Pro) deacylase)
MQPATHPSALRVQAVLGPDFAVMEFTESTRTAADAAAAVGCAVGQIAKSLVFRQADGEAVLVVASGTNRVSEAKVAALLGQGIGRADAGFVREVTGFAIGGIPPVGHAKPLTTIVDESLGRFDEIWAAAGTPNAVFRLTYADLLWLTGGRAGEIAEG